MNKEFEKLAQKRGLDTTKASYYEYEAAGCRCRILSGKKYEDSLTQLIFEMCREFYERGRQNAKNPD